MDWDHKYPVREIGNGKVRAVGMGMAMQGSGIDHVDVGSATLKINDDGFYTLSIGAADMGTGCDTILRRLPPKCWNARWKTLRFWAQIPILPPMIPVPMRPAQLM